jgi:hypothetical protein
MSSLHHHPDEYADTTHHTVYASPWFRDRRRFSFVALEGQAANGDADPWCALRLARGRGGARARARAPKVTRT